MKKVISISEIVAPIRVENDLCNVWASAEADYHEGKLEVKLESFLRRSSDNERASASWLPERERRLLSTSVSKKEVRQLKRSSKAG
jgi:hypothetical protein